MIHTILGAGGPVSNVLYRELASEGKKVRLASRRPVPISGTAEWTKTDLLNKDQVFSTVKGSAVVYLCAGLRYDKKVWAVEWPLLMNNVIQACKAAGARLIFFDNVYMYGRVKGPMLETTPYNPISVKGEIRAKVAETLMQEFGRGNLNGSIARAADFYGAESMNSFYDAMVLARMAQKEKALWLGNPTTFHSFTYVPDAGKAMAVLGNNPSADHQIWHLPTAAPMKGHAFIELAAQHFKVPAGYFKFNRLMLEGMGIFKKMLQETAEMYYQYEFDYQFNSDKFQQAFGMKPVSYQEGIREFSPFLRGERIERAPELKAA